MSLSREEPFNTGCTGVEAFVFPVDITVGITSTVPAAVVVSADPTLLVPVTVAVFLCTSAEHVLPNDCEAG